MMKLHWWSHSLDSLEFWQTIFLYNYFLNYMLVLELVKKMKNTIIVLPPLRHHSLTPIGPKCVFWQHSDFGQLIMNGVFCFFLKFSYNICPRSSFKAQQFSSLLTAWFKNYCIICSFQRLVGSPSNKKDFFKNHFLKK